MVDGLEQTGTAPTLRLAVRFMLLTGVRNGEFIGATWAEAERDRAQWSIPAERMKAGKPHTGYLAEQAHVTVLLDDPGWYRRARAVRQ